MEKITSKSNNWIKQATKLSAAAGHRKKSGQFLLEGVRLCCDVLHSQAKPLCVLVTENCLARQERTLAPLLAASTHTFLLTEELAARLGDTVHPQGVFCICEMGLTPLTLHPEGRYLVLDRVQDPSNLGAIARNAEALGLNGAILCGCADVYNPKALRASMGSLLRLPVMNVAELTTAFSALRQQGIRILATVPDQAAMPVTQVPMNGGLAMVIGNEANGVSEQVLAQADLSVTIPMAGRAESLNAAAAALIAMWEMMRRATNEG